MQWTAHRPRGRSTASTRRAVPARGRVLVVEHEEAPRRLQALLGEAGYEVITVRGPESAMVALRLQRPDAVLADLSGLGGAGLQLLDETRARDPDRPVIVMTDRPSIRSATAALRGGAFDYLAKPVRRPLLLGSVRRAAEGYALIKEKRRLEEANARQAATLAAYVRRVQSLSEARDRLATLLVHDLKNPLSVITANIEVLRARPELIALDEEVRSGLDDAHDASRGLLHMITMLLDISRMEEDALPLAREDLPLDELIDRCVGRFRTSARARQVRLEREVSPEPSAAPTVAVDRMLIERVLDNLISNGLRHAPRGRGRLIVRGLRERERAVITVENDGPPIPLALHARIFDKYGQVGPGDQAGCHRGLGLYFCRLAVEAHGGAISVGERPGGGVRFRIELPRNAG